MDPVFEAFHKALSALHENAKRTLAGLSPDQLDWRPGDDMNSLTAMLDSGLELAGRAFAALSVEQLSELRVSPRDKREFSVAWSIGHVLQHTALHLGHMELTRQLLADGRM